MTLAGWYPLVAAFAAFFVSHTIPVRPGVKTRMIAVLGARGFTLLYSGLSLGMLGWLIAAAGRAPYVALWPYAPWQNHVPLVVMAGVCVIVALSLARPNPFSFGGARNDSFDPARAGLVRYTRHPLLAAIFLWAAAHLVPNGDLAHVLVFGSFAGFAVLGMALIDRRKRRQIGPCWEVMDAARRNAPLLPRPMSWTGAIARGLGGLALYAALIWAHPWLFGVSPLV